MTGLIDRLVPYRPLIGVVVLAALLGSGVLAIKLYGARQYKRGHAAAVAERASRDAVAVLRRTSDNAALSIKQDAINAILTKAKHEELAPVRERIVTQRVYVGAALCDGPAAPAQAEGAAGGDRPDSPGRLVRADLERDIKALKLAVEEDLATGRACQAFLRENGLVP